MSAGGDATIAVAYSQVGVTEQPPSSNNVSYWDWWGCNLGSWCGAFVSWACAHAGYPLPVIDYSCSGDATGFVLCSNGTLYAYQHGQVPANAEPGDLLIFSWYPWELQNGIPIISSGEWAGWVAGDHTGFFAQDLGGGYIRTVEGNTSQSSWDNGGAVLERTDRYWGQICALWRPANFGSSSGGGGTGPPPPSNLTGLGMFLLANDRRGIWLMGPGYAYGLNPEEYSQVAGIPGIQTFQCGANERAFDVIYQSCMNGVTAEET
jgi:hypothetical protein